MDVPTKTTVASPDEVKDFLHLPVQTADKRVNVKEENTEEISKLDIDAEMGKEQLKRLIEDNKARKTFSYWIFTATVLWMFFVLMIVVQCGRGSIHLNDGVLIALITTTTANVFGFLYVVVNYLFNRNKSLAQHPEVRSAPPMAGNDINFFHYFSCRPLLRNKKRIANF